MTMKDLSTLGSTEYSEVTVMKGSDAISPQAADVVDPALTGNTQHLEEKTVDRYTPKHFEGGDKDAGERDLEEEIKAGNGHAVKQYEHALREKYHHNINNVNSNSSDIESDYDKDELIPDSPRVNYSENRGADFSQRLPGNFNPYSSPFTAEEARLRYSLESEHLKERFRQSLNDEVLRRGFAFQDQRQEASKISPGSRSVSQPTSPESKSLTSSPLSAFQGQGQSSRSHNLSYDEQDSVLIPQIREGLYFCHLCSFSGTTQQDFDLHMTVHFEHVCPHCDYKSRTEGRLKRHIKDFHTEDEEGGFGTRTMPGRPKVFRCKQCEFSSTDKVEFWAHSRTHIKEDKLLQCPRCPFVTEYKHHLEYHLRNHFGSKPFKCPKCNYACVNKSMLNSHMKSHTNVYQYRCADCTYATKYCHSLKLHLRKYNHKPAAVLNSDGSLPQGMDATASGLSLLTKRGPPRGPRGPRKDKLDPSAGQFLQMSPGQMSGMAPMQGLPGIPGMMPPFWPMMHSQLPNGMNGMPSPHGLSPRFSGPLHGLLGMGMGMKSEEMKSPPKVGGGLNTNANPFKCNFCSFVGNNREVLTSHIMKVHASENHDLFSIFGISSESLLEDNHKRMNVLNALRSPMKSPRTGMFGLNPEMPLNIKKEVMDNIPPKASHEKHGQGNKEQLSPFSYMNGKFPADANVKDEGIDILKQMTLKFGSGPTSLKRKFDTVAESHSTTVTADSPLDLTKPRNSPPLLYPTQPFSALNSKNDDGNHSSGESSIYSNEVTSPTPRKRSRKGKAFKLDTLCMKLQEKQGGVYESDEDSPGEMDEMYTSDLLPVDADVSVNSPNSENNRESNEIEMEKDKSEAEMSTNKMSDKYEEKEDGKENGENEEWSEEEEEKDRELVEEDLRQIHSSLDILNEKKTEAAGKTTIDENEASQTEIDMENRPKQPTLRRTPSPNYIIKPTETPPQLLSHSRRKAVPAAVQRGADIAWKMLNDPKFSDPSKIIGNGNNNGHRMELSAMDKKLWFEAPECTSDLSKKSDYQCTHCQISFGDCIMYTMHMGYHGYKDPYKCNMCGDTCKDRVEFFLHIARAAHN